MRKRNEGLDESRYIKRLANEAIPTSVQICSLVARFARAVVTVESFGKSDYTKNCTVL